MRQLDDRIQRLLDGELPADEERALRQELAKDPAAARDLEQVEVGLSALAERRPLPLPEGFKARVMARVAARPGPRTTPGIAVAMRDLLRGLSWPRAAAMAAVLVLVGGTAALLGYRAGSRSQGAVPSVSTDAPRPTVFVRFTLTAPEARQVELAGSFNGWGARKIVLARGENGAWNATVELPRGRYEYAFVVDGQRFVADGAAADFADDGFGDRNAVLDI